MGEAETKQPTAFGRLVKQMREARNLGQEGLADAAHLSKGLIGGIETGDRGKRPARDTVLAIAQALRATPTERRRLLESAGRLIPADSDSSLPSYQEVVMADPRLRSDQKRVLISTYEAFVGKT